MRLTAGRPLLGLLLAAWLPMAAALAQGGSEGLSPTLARVKAAHVVHLGYRESSPPFSFLDQAGRPIGYSLELCEAVVDEIATEVDDPDLKIDYVKVTSDEYLTARPNWRSASPGLPAGDFLFSKISAPACPGRQRRRHLIFPNPSTGPGLGYFMEPGAKGSAKSTT